MRALILSFLLVSTAQAKVVVLQAARLYDGRGEALQKPGRVVVENGRITGVGSQAKAPGDAEVIDLGDATLLPGMMDAHTHTTFEMTDDWKQDELDGFKKSVAQQAIESTAFARRTIE